MLLQIPAGADPGDIAYLYEDDARMGAVHEVAVTATTDGYDADVTGLVGRFYPVVYLDDADTPSDLPAVDLPLDPALLISPESLAVAADIPLPLAGNDRAIIRDAIRDAQADVTAYLGRPVIPTAYVQHHAYPYDDGWRLTEHGMQEVLAVTGATPEVGLDGTPTGYFTVTYLSGLDAANDPALYPIVRYVKAHALYSPTFVRLWKRVTSPKGDITNVSAEGQSVTYMPATLGASSNNQGAPGGMPGSGDPGALPTLASLDTWRIRGREVYQSRSRFGEWPYRGMGI